MECDLSTFLLNICEFFVDLFNLYLIQFDLFEC